MRRRYLYFGSFWTFDWAIFSGRWLLGATLLGMGSLGLRADVTLPSIFSEHLVLQRAEQVPVWGKAAAGETVTVTLEGRSAQVTADAEGKWKVSFNLKDAGPGPFEMIIAGRNQIKFSDVVVGEVWLASGQSNMGWNLRSSLDSEKVIAQSANPLLRQFQVKQTTSPVPLDDVEGQWTVAGPETSPDFTAVGYFFGQYLQKALQVPVGIIGASWPGTPSEAWTSEQGLDQVPDLKATKERLWKRMAEQPDLKRAFVTNFEKWARDNAREDGKTASAENFLTSKDRWKPMQLPGELKADWLPPAGVIWLRKVVEMPADAVDRTARLILGKIEGFPAIYWNGELVKQETYETLPSSSILHTFQVPARLIKVGANGLAVRIYSPVELPKIEGPLQVDGMDLAGTWEARMETVFPALDAAAIATAPKPPSPGPGPASVGGYLFNGMIHPLIPYAIKGVIWYQGESNAKRAFQYRTAFPLLIEDWRAQWGQGAFPFYFCQLANFGDKSAVPEESDWAELREAQSLGLKLPGTGQAILVDLGESGSIHPRNKRDVGERLSRIALNRDYGRNVPFSGPVYESMQIEGNRIRLSFAEDANGLVARAVPATFVVQTGPDKTGILNRNSPNSELEGFAICGADRKWVWADAKIEGDAVWVWSSEVAHPIAVRYSWAKNPSGNLANTAGLPASPFRTDDFPAVTREVKY